MTNTPSSLLALNIPHLSTALHPPIIPPIQDPLKTPFSLIATICPLQPPHHGSLQFLHTYPLSTTRLSSLLQITRPRHLPPTKHPYRLFRNTRVMAALARWQVGEGVTIPIIPRAPSVAMNVQLVGKHSPRPVMLHATTEYTLGKRTFNAPNQGACSGFRAKTIACNLMRI